MNWLNNFEEIRANWANEVKYRCRGCGFEPRSLHKARHHYFVECNMSNEKVSKYLQSYSGKNLLKKYELSTYGIWRILGEDPNCDFGGFHHQPFLQTVEGTLEDVIEYAVELPSFYTWGGGGTLEKQDTPLKVDRAIIRQKAAVDREIAELEEKLKALKEKQGAR